MYYLGELELIQGLKFVIWIYFRSGVCFRRKPYLNFVIFALHNLYLQFLTGIALDVSLSHWITSAFVLK